MSLFIRRARRTDFLVQLSLRFADKSFLLAGPFFSVRLVSLQRVGGEFGFPDSEESCADMLIQVRDSALESFQCVLMTDFRGCECSEFFGSADEHVEVGPFFLRTLERFSSVEQVLNVAAECRPYQTIRVADPEGEYRVLLPGDEGYDSASGLTEKGHIRLYL